MRNRVLLGLMLALLLTAAFNNSIGQTLKVVPPAPNAMKMTEYQSQRPNMYTGTASVSIPLHTINFDGWELPISISYNATGIRTGEEASEVGLGWALSATGVISRTVRGFDDFYPGGLGDGRGRGYVYNTTPLPEPFNLGYNQLTTRSPFPGTYYFYLNASRPDTDPDVFNYNFFGYSGQFILSQKEKDPAPNPNKKITAIKLTQDATSIIFNEAAMTFTIITPTGFKGEFTAKERSTSTSGNRNAPTAALACGEDKIDFVYLQNYSGQLRVITSWYLTKITSPRDKEIKFNYDLDSITGNSLYISNGRTFGEDEQSAQNPLCLHTIQENVYLKDITYNDNIKLEFAMEEREDLRRNVLFDPSSIAVHLFPYGGNLKRYTGIHITGMNGSTLNKNITLSQTYFNEQHHKKLSNDEEEWTWLRSRLDAVIIDDQQYRFNYYKGANGVPNKQTHAVDHFGFYNGQDANDHLLWPTLVGGVNDGFCNLADSVTQFQYLPNQRRLPDFEYAQAGLLKKVMYPTTGYVIYEYEGHSYMPETTGLTIEPSGLKKAGGARVKSIKEYDYTNVLLRQRSYRYTPLGEVDLINQLPSTGRLMTPLLNLGKAAMFIKDHPAYGSIPPNSCNFIVESNSSIPGNNAAEGKIIGYSVVHEIVDGGSTSYKNTYYFENTPNKILKTLLAVESSGNLNGHTKETRNRNSDGKVVQITADSLYNTSLAPLQGITYRPGGVDAEHLWYYQDHKIKRTFIAPTITKTITATTPSGVVENSTTGAIVTLGSVIKTQKKLAYKNYQLSSEEIVNSNGDILKTEYKRPLDYPSPGGGLPYMINQMRNIIEPVIEEISYKNGAVIAAKANWYGVASKFSLISSYTYNPTLGAFTFTPSAEVFIAPYEKKIEYTGLDLVGNITEYKTQDGVTNSFVWGYNNTLPVVHGVGISNSQLSQAYTETVGLSNYETALRNHPNLAGKQVTTFDHNPQVGLLKITDPAGLKKTFAYDTYSRLAKVLDNDGKTLEQYQFHFRERQSSRIVSLSGNVNFGTLTPDMYVTSPDYVKCSESLKSKILTISNTGEDNLLVYSVTPPTGFKSSWNGGIIPPDESVDIIITFDNTVSLGTYSGNISISSDQTAGPASVTASATYANRICSFTVPPTFDFGVVSGGVYNNQLPITNSGNAVVELLAAPLDWNGTGLDYWNFKSPDFSIATTFEFIADPAQLTRHAVYCIAPGQTFSMPVNFTPQPGQYNGIKTAKLSLITDINPAVCQSSFKDISTIKADYQRPVSLIAMSTNSIDLGSFTEASKPTTVTVTNTGTLGFSITGITFSNPAAAPYFSVSPATATLLGGESVVLNIAYTPAVFGTINTNITIGNNAMLGDETIAFTASRYSSRKIVLTPSAGELVFDYTGQPKSMTIANGGNDSFTVTEVTPNTSVQGFSINAVSSTTLSPGQSMNVTVIRTGIPSPDQLLTIQSNANEGPTTFWIKAVTRTINYSNNPLNFSSFTGATSGSTFSVSNQGSQTLTISNITSSNSRFSISPTSFSVGPGGSQNVTATYTPTDFNQQTSSFTFYSDATNTSSNSISVSAQRVQLKQVNISSTSVYLKPSTGAQTIYITNTGNMPVAIGAPAKTDPSNAFVVQYNGSTPSANTLQPGSTLAVTVSTSGGYSSANGSMTISTDTSAGTYSITLARSMF